MSALGLGTAQLGLPYGVSDRSGQPSEAEAAAILEYALESGVGVIDTAPAYGDAEALLGRLLPDGGVRIVTKTPPLACAELTTAACDAVRRSAKARSSACGGPAWTGCSSITGPSTASQGPSAMRDAGIAQQLGVSVYTHDELSVARELLPLDVVQLPVNVLDQRFLRDGTLEELHAEGVEVHVRSVFLQGLLLMKPEELPVHLTAAEPPLRRFTRCAGTVSARSRQHSPSCITGSASTWSWSAPTPRANWRSASALCTWGSNAAWTSRRWR